MAIGNDPALDRTIAVRRTELADLNAQRRATAQELGDLQSRIEACSTLVTTLEGAVKAAKEIENQVGTGTTWTGTPAAYRASNAADGAWSAAVVARDAAYDALVRMYSRIGVLSTQLASLDTAITSSQSQIQTLSATQATPTPASASSGAATRDLVGAGSGGRR